MSRRAIGWWLLFPALLGACAGNGQSRTAAATPEEPDCSFRSASTCWTLGARLPPPRADSTARPRESLESPAAFAMAGDSAAGGEAARDTAAGETAAGRGAAVSR
jgi:hypothetical protein